MCSVKHAVTLHSPASGRYMDLFTNMPGLQFYSGNNLNGSTIGKGGVAYQQYGGLALESQVIHPQPHPASCALLVYWEPFLLLHASRSRDSSRDSSRTLRQTSSR